MRESHVAPFSDITRMPTPVRLIERKHRRMVMESSLDRGIIGCGLVFLGLAVALTTWALASDGVHLPLIDTCYTWLLDFALAYLGLYCLGLPAGSVQTLTLDKNLNSVTVKTRRLTGLSIDRYRLDEVIKVHHNRVDDGTFDKHAILLIFRGGGAIQFPPGGGQPTTMTILAESVTQFLGVVRSDAPMPVKPPVPRAPRRTKVTVAWEPRELAEPAGTAPLDTP